MSKLNKPPVVEVWLAIDVDPNPAGLAWGPAVAESFHRKHAREFGDIELEYSQQVKVAKSGSGLPTIVEEETLIQRVRAFDAARSRCIQFSGDRAVFNSLRPGPTYPGFPEVLKEAEDLFRSYLDFFRPLSIRMASLCYIDVINIPVDEGGLVVISDYFTIAKDLPDDPFGTMIQHSLQAVLKCPTDEGPAVMNLQSLPGMHGQKFARFFMETQKTCLGIDSLDLDRVKERLSRSKEYISTCFKNSFTEQGWDLFEPEPNN